MRINVKYCITVKGVNLWNSCSEELKTCKTLSKCLCLIDSSWGDVSVHRVDRMGKVSEGGLRAVVTQ